MTAFNTSIAGINKHSGPDVLDSIHVDEPLTLIREPKNRFDPNAVSVHYKGYKLGYVPAVQAGVVARIMDSSKPMYAKLIRSGFEDKYIWAEMRVYENESENKVVARRGSKKPAQTVTKDMSFSALDVDKPTLKPATNSNRLTDLQRTFLWFAVIILFLILISMLILP